MKIMIASIKGGSGKTTTAINIATRLALMDRDVCILDSDRQPSASTWASDREDAEISPEILCVQKFENIRESINNLSKRYTDVIIDVGGRDGKSMRTGLTVADAVIVTSKASQLDIDTLPSMVEVINSAMDYNEGLISLGLVTMSPTGFMSKEKAGAKKYFGKFPVIKLLNSVTHERKIYRDVMSEGIGVCESKNLKAKAEIELLVAEVMSHVQG